MLKTRTAVIIGAGIGGISTSIFLAKSGYSVKVLEKNQNAGGRCGRIIRDGHRFDLGATILLMPGIYRKVFADMGLDFDEVIRKKNMDNLYRIYFSNGKTLDFTTDREHLKAQLESMEPGSYARAQEYIKTGYEFFRLSVERLLGRNFTSFFEFATPGNLILLIRLKSYLKHTFYIKRYFSNPDLRKAFTFQNIYVGQNPLNAPALFAMIPASELSEGSFFPEGGMAAITDALLSTAKNLGVEFQYSKPVRKILTGNNTVEGIETESGEIIKASVVVANADLPYVYRDLLPGSDKNKYRHIRYGCSAIVLHWGLDRQYPELSHHNVFLSGKYEANLKKIFRLNSLSSEPSFYIHAPCRTDPAAAPDGHDTLSVIIPCGHLGLKDDNDWLSLKEKARESVLERLKQTGLHNIDNHIKFEICYMPQTWKSVFNLSRGATFGSVAHNIFQMGYFRPHNRHSKYRNLYFTGGSTHPGNGVPLVLLSAKLTTARIMNEL